MKTFVTALALSALILSPLASAAFAAPPGAYYQQQQRGSAVASGRRILKQLRMTRRPGASSGPRLFENQCSNAASRELHTFNLMLVRAIGINSRL